MTRDTPHHDFLYTLRIFIWAIYELITTTTERHANISRATTMADAGVNAIRV